MTPDPTASRSMTDHAGWVDRSARSRLEVAGPDRAKFLHNLTTNDVKRLAEGSGHESFVTSPQGKTLAYATLLAAGGSMILLRTDPASTELVLPHLRKYGVFDDVTIEDASSRTFEFHVAGPSAAATLEGRGVALPDEGSLRHRSVDLGGFDVRVVRESPAGRPGFTLIGPSEGADAIRGMFAEAGLVEVDASTFESLRIEAGTPISGLDVSATNLPQEVGRDALAINFVKGCYLGQETVARLDALGHVNRIFKGLRLPGGAAVPPVGSTILADGKPVGSVTSSAHSTGWGSPIALAYLRVAQAIAGTELTIDATGGPVAAIVHDLPMLPPSA